MQKLAEDVYLLHGFPKYAINVYLIGDVLIDAGTRMAKKRILNELKGKDLKAHALTHAHPDHQGSSKAVCLDKNIPLWCGEGDRHAMETGDYSRTTPKGRGNKFPNTLLNGPPHPVSKALREGDEVAGFHVYETPGHTPGHLSYFRESDGVLIVGDVVFGMNMLTMARGVYEPPKLFTLNPEQNRTSIRKIAALEPKLCCFGHGKPLADPSALREFVDALPQS